MRRLLLALLVCFVLLLFTRNKEEKWTGLAVLTAFVMYLLYIYRITGGI